MESPTDFLVEPKSLEDLSDILVKLKSLELNLMNKKLYTILLSGFNVIVNIYESNHPDAKKEANEKIILDWIRLYLDIQSLVASSEAHLVIFLKSLPIAVTYIIGCLLHVSNVSYKFYTEFLKTAAKLVSQTDKRILKKLQVCGKGLIPYLWTVVDKVGNFNTQMMVLQLIYFILKNYDEKLALFEVEQIANLSAISKEKLLQLLKVKSNDITYQKLSREILNQYNKLQGSKSLVHSFSCESFNIADQFSFSKEKHCDCFWIDINSEPYTLTFHGLLLSTGKSGSCDESVDVSLDIKKFFCYKEKLKLEFIPPADISSISIDIGNMNEAYAELPDYETKRFCKIFKANVLKLQHNENKIKEVENFTSNSDMIETFKKPSLELYQSAIGKLKPQMNSRKQMGLKRDSHNKTHQTTNAGKHLFNQKRIPTHIYYPAKDSVTNAGNRRFFKNPRQPKKLELPWKIPPMRKSIVTRNQKNQVEEIQHITKPNVSQKRANDNNNLEIPEKRQRISIADAYDGLTTSKGSMKLRNQMQVKECVNIKLKTILNQCHETLQIYPNTIQASTTLKPFDKKFEVVDSPKPKSITSLNTNYINRQNENSTNSANEDKKTERSRIRGSIKRAILNLNSDSSSDESEFSYPQKKERRCTQSQKEGGQKHDLTAQIFENTKHSANATLSTTIVLNHQCPQVKSFIEN